jgi:hypothetical protein
VDVVLLTLACTLGFGSYQYFTNGYVVNFNHALGIGVLTSAVFISLLRSQGLYEVSSVTNPLRQLKLVWISLAITLLLLTGCLFVLKCQSARKIDPRSASKIDPPYGLHDG